MYSVHFTVLWIVKLLCQNFLYEKNIDFITVDKNFIYFLFSENYKRYLKHILKVFLILHFEHFQIFLEILLMWSSWYLDLQPTKAYRGLIYYLYSITLWCSAPQTTQRIKPGTGDLEAETLATRPTNLFENVLIKQ